MLHYGAIVVRGGPYASTKAGIGGVPTTTVDVPITTVFLCLYILGAVVHMAILQLNKKRGHKFLISGAMFGFCMSRITTCTMRLVWSTHRTIPIGIAANILVNAGVVLLIVINLLLAQRILRAMHPNLGWSHTIHWIFTTFYASIPLVLVMLITSIVIQFYTLNQHTLSMVHKVTLVGGTYNLVAASAPIPIITLSALTRKFKVPSSKVDKFGSGRFRTKLVLVLVAATLIALGAGFRAGTNYVQPLLDKPAWFDSKACFYIFNFTIEIAVVYMYAAMRIDLRFHIPDGAKGPGSYSVTKVRVETEEEFEMDFSPDGGEDAGKDTEEAKA